MANTDRERRLTLLAEVDAQSSREGERRIRDLRQEFESLEMAERDASRASQQTGSALNDLGRGQQAQVRFLEARIKAERELTEHLQDEIRLLKHIQHSMAALIEADTDRMVLSISRADRLFAWFTEWVFEQGRIRGAQDERIQAGKQIISGGN